MMYEVGVKQNHEIAPWAFDAVNDAIKQNLVRREFVPIQTHNAVSVPLSGSAVSAVIDCRGMDSVSVGFKSDAQHQNKVELSWHPDSGGVNIIILETISATGSRLFGGTRLTVKASYCTVKVFNEDAALAHIMSSWTTLIP